MGPNSLYGGKLRKISKSCSDLDLGPTMPNIELVRFFFHYTTTYLNFRFLDQFRAKTHTHRNTHTHTEAHKDSDEYSIVAFCKNAMVLIEKFLYQGLSTLNAYASRHGMDPFRQFVKLSVIA